MGHEKHWYHLTPDPTGNNTALDLLTVQTTVAWDDFGRKTKETDPLNQAWTYSYDPNNNLITSLDPPLQTTAYSWDTGHQLNTVRDQSGNTTRTTRNALGAPSACPSSIFEFQPVEFFPLLISP